MRKLKYILMLILSIGLLNSCLVDDSTDFDMNDAGKNIATFNAFTQNLSIQADDLEHVVNFSFKVAGPTLTELTSDITVTVGAAASSTAEVNTHYRILTPTITLTKANNYLANVEVAIVTVGNAPLEEDDPGYEEWLEDYVAPVLVLEVISATGDDKVINSGKTLAATINYVSFCYFAGDYDVEMRYFHPTAGGSYPTDPDFDPNSPYGGIRSLEKTLTPLSSKKCEFDFGVWGPDEICYIVIDPDTYLVTELVTYTWTYTVALGNPYDASQISHYDPVDGKIYLYYNYMGSGGYRIFWEVLTPKF